MKRYSCSSCRILVYCYAMTCVGIRIWNFVNTGNEPQYSTLRAQKITNNPRDVVLSRSLLLLTRLLRHSFITSMNKTVLTRCKTSHAVLCAMSSIFIWRKCSFPKEKETSHTLSLRCDGMRRMHAH